LVNQQKGAWSMQSGLAVNLWERLIKFGCSGARVNIKSGISCRFIWCYSFGLELFP
jgi:hypothetical protein